MDLSMSTSEGIKMEEQLHQAIPAPVPSVTVDPSPFLNLPFTFIFAFLLFIIIGLFALYRHGMKMQKHELTQDDQWLVK